MRGSWIAMGLVLFLGVACGGGGTSGDAATGCDPACTGVTPFCDSANNRCVVCLGDKDCGTGTICGVKDGAAACVKGCTPGAAGDADCVVRGDGTACCDRSCVDLQSDVANCGGCGTACPTPANGKAACEAGQCGLDSCDPGYKDCDQDLANGCEAHTDGDPQNCGACGKACPALAQASSVCTGGVCGLGACLPGWDDCDGDPTNGCETLLNNDPGHCGSCARSCQAVANGSTACKQGTCGIGACNPGYDDCDGNPANGCETELRSDARSCGTCGNTCAFAHASATCQSGTCQVGTCATGWGNCNGVASDGCERSLSDDANNCGGCGHLCTAGAHATVACMNSTCAVTGCDAGWADCDADSTNGCEAQVQSDARNCGGCGMACPTLAHATVACRSGVCGVGACDAGWADCDSNPNNGCETNTKTDALHCGSCIAACPGVANADTTCQNGSCALTCRAGWGDCDGNAGNGCEKDLGGDMQNCGACDKICTAGNFATVACQSGACTVTGCTLGHSDCDGNPDNGCEVNHFIDAQNCGTCGQVCAGPHQNGQCNNGSCTATCQTGWGDCDGNATNGCETDLKSDRAHCGSCTTTCTGAAHADAACSNSACALACQTGWGNCDGDAANGCEADLGGDAQNCGACGKACTFAHGSGACGGVCVLTGCDEGYTSCDGNDANGCEAYITASAKNCGTCGHACTGATPYCQQGVCAASPTVLQVVAGGYHTCARLADGTVWCWGENNYGQLGNGASDSSAHSKPVSVPGLTDVVELAAGYNHTCARLADGTVSCWGNNIYGQLGDASGMSQRNSPVKVYGLANAKRIALGANSNHTCAQLRDGSVYCWGNNGYGQLGDGGTTNRNSPFKVSGLSNVVELECGGNHTCVRLGDGTMSCWGYNGYGQLGDGTSINHSAPVNVSGIANVMEFGLGSAHTCARLGDGTVYCWGYNSEGELGVTPTDGLAHPNPVFAGLNGIANLYIGAYHGFAADSGGATYGWARNDYGQLGDGSNTGRPASVYLSALAGSRQVAGGYYHSCALLQDGSVSCWGYNAYGQLGDTTTNNRNVSTPVVW